MKLNFKDRLVILNMLPQKSSIADQLICKSIREKIDISEEMKLELDFKIDVSQNIATWNENKADKYDCDFLCTEIEVNFLKNIVESLDNEKLVDKENLSVCLKIKNYDNHS